jgi:N-acetyl-anhydromuramyl-L-alanine amidase AmpD
MEIINKILEKGEFFQENTPKTVFYLHHTAGGHRPDWVIDAWNTDDVVDKTGKLSPRSVATSFVIGGVSTRDPRDTSFDGKIYRAFDENFWAHHLGTSLKNNRQLNQISIGVEVCNYGYLRKGTNGQFFTYVNNIVPPHMVVELDKPFRGYKYYHKYTDKQIESLKFLILEMKKKFPNIQLKTPLLSPEGFELNSNANKGVSGIFSHSNIRKDKFDMFPQTNLINMLKEICSPL